MSSPKGKGKERAAPVEETVAKKEGVKDVKGKGKEKTIETSFAPVLEPLPTGFGVEALLGNLDDDDDEADGSFELDIGDGEDDDSSSGSEAEDVDGDNEDDELVKEVSDLLEEIDEETSGNKRGAHSTGEGSSAKKVRHG